MGSDFDAADRLRAGIPVFAWRIGVAGHTDPDPANFKQVPEAAAARRPASLNGCWVRPDRMEDPQELPRPGPVAWQVQDAAPPRAGDQNLVSRSACALRWPPSSRPSSHPQSAAASGRCCMPSPGSRARRRWRRSARRGSGSIPLRRCRDEFDLVRSNQTAISPCRGDACAAVYWGTIDSNPIPSSFGILDRP